MDGKPGKDSTDKGEEERLKGRFYYFKFFLFIP